MSDSNKWHVRVLGSEWGPVDLDGLKHLVSTGGLSEDDSIRELGQDEWLPAATLVEIFPGVTNVEAEPSKSQDAVSESAVDELPSDATPPSSPSTTDEAATYQLSKPQVADQPTEAVNTPVGSLSDVELADELPDEMSGNLAGDLADELADDLAAEMDQDFLDNLSANDDEVTDEPEEPVSKSQNAATASKQIAQPDQQTPVEQPATPARSPIHRAGVLVWAHLRYNSIVHVLLLIGVVFAVLWNVVIAPPEKTAMQTYQEIWDEIKGMRQRDASDSEWEKFTKRSEERINDVVADLESSASASNPARQELLWAGNRFLRRMLQDARGEASASEENFVKHIEKAKRVLDGTERKFGEDDPPPESDPNSMTGPNVPFGAGPALYTKTPPSPPNN